MPKNTKTHSDIANDLMHLSHKNFSTLLSSYIGSDTKDIYDKSYMDTVVISDMHDSNALRIVNTAKYLLKDQLPDPNPFTARDKAAALKQTLIYNEQLLKLVKYKMMYDNFFNLYDAVRTHLATHKNEWDDNSIKLITEFNSDAKKLLLKLSKIEDPADKEKAINLFIEWSWAKCNSICPPSLKLNMLRQILLYRDSEVFDQLKLPDLKQLHETRINIGSIPEKRLQALEDELRTISDNALQNISREPWKIAQVNTTQTVKAGMPLATRAAHHLQKDHAAKTNRSNEVPRIKK